MAGGGDQKDNPVAINVVPMVDVIFCLCVFFMCSFKFKILEGKFDTWLPKDKGLEGTPTNEIVQETRVQLFWDAKKQVTNRRLGTRMVNDDAQLEQFLKESRDDLARLGKTDAPVTIDAEQPVPWLEVTNVMNICKRNGLEKIEFAFGAKTATK